MTVNRELLITRLVELQDKRNDLIGQANLIDKQCDKILDNFEEWELNDIWSEVIKREAHNNIDKGVLIQ